MTNLDSQGRIRRYTRTHRVALAAGALMIAATSLVAIAGAWPLWSLVMISAVAACFSGYGAWMAVPGRLRVIAPAAICIVALLNPLVIVGAVTNVQTYAGLVLPNPNGPGLVLWKLYPGIAGWTAPAHPVPIDATGRLKDVQTGMTAVKASLSKQFRQTWQTDDTPVGVLPVANGYGGQSLFVSIAPAPWHTRMVGTSDERATMIDETTALAVSLGLDDEPTTIGVPATGDGTLNWHAANETLTLRFDGEQITFTYLGGPFLPSTSYRGEYESRMRPFEGIPQPEQLSRLNPH